MADRLNFHNCNALEIFSMHDWVYSGFIAQEVNKLLKK